MTFAIAGVSGNTGKVAAETLLAQGKKVRVIVRDAAKGEAWKTKGAEVAVADLADSAALTKAFAGISGAYVLVPPNMAAADFGAYQDGITESLRAAIAAANVPHVVLLSSVGAQLPSGTGPIAGLHRTENTLKTVSGTHFSFLRAGYFIENLGGSLSMLGEGLLPSFVPATLGIEMIATFDIGKLAAQLLVEGATSNQIIELGGPAKTMNDAAAALSTLTGKTISVHVAPLEAMVPTLTGFGFPESMAKLYAEMTGAMIDGTLAFEGTHRRLHGTTTIAEVLAPMLTR